MRYLEIMTRRSAGCFVVALAILAGIPSFLLCGLRPRRLDVPPPGFELGPVTVVDPGRGASPARRVVVRGDRIERIDPVLAGARDGLYAGATVVPGLIDLHVHHPSAVAVGERDLFALLFLAHGVTSVRDTGSLPPWSLRSHARAIAVGDRPGPRIFRCGQLLDGDPPAWPGSRPVRTPAEAREAVGALAAAGMNCVKLYNGLSGEVVSEILTAARAHELPVVAHVPWSVSLEQLPEVEVQHLMGLTDDWEQLTGADVVRYVERSLSLGLSHLPTLVSFARAAGLREADVWEREPVARLLPRYYGEILWRPERRWLAPPQATRIRVEAMKRVIAALRAAGVPVLVGTDTMNPLVVPGAALHEELRHLVDAGFAPEEVWVAATRRAGETLGVPGLGRLEPGAPADLLIFSEDPTRDLRALPTLLAVVARGRLYSKDALDQAVEDALTHFHGFPYEPMSMTAVSAGLSWLEGQDE
jgi:imidazolonepropionase-like amidohydrolase